MLTSKWFLHLWIHKNSRLVEPVGKWPSMHGDSIHAGMTRFDMVTATLKLLSQFAEPGGVGHFYYAPGTAAGQTRRNSLVEYLYSRGLR